VQPAQKPFDATRPRPGLNNFTLAGVENFEALSNPQLDICEPLIIARRQAFNS
jgi:hypothetical protein